MWHRRRKGPVESLVLNVAACAWLVRAMWRVKRGRAPWNARRNPARSR
jgi:hypothetical protein